MLKVAHFIDSLDPGGAESIVIEICKKIGDYGYEPVVFHFGNSWLEEKCRQNGISAALVSGHRCYTSAITIPLFSLIFARFLLKQRVDILHSHLFGPVTSACFSTYLARIPHIGTLHDIYTIEEKKNRMRYLRLSSRLGTKLVTVSNQMRTYMTDLGRFHNGSIQTIVNGVDVEKYSVSVARKQYPDLGLMQDDIVFICVGRLERIKGHDTLLKAFKKLMPRDNVKLLIVGDGPCRAQIEQQIGETGLQNNVKMLGHRNDIPILLNLSDCFVLASRSEGLSCSIIEAMAAGLPVIATDVGGNRELILDGLNGYLVAPDDPDSLTRELKNIANDNLKRKKFGESSGLRAQEHYSLEIMLARYADSYREMITSHPD